MRPSEAWREYLRCPAGLMEQIIEYRSYAAAKLIYERTPDAPSELVQLVKRIDFELANEYRDAQKGGRAE